MKIVKQFQLKIVILTAVKIRCILHGRVFVTSASVPLRYHAYAMYCVFSRLYERYFSDEKL